MAHRSPFRADELEHPIDVLRKDAHPSLLKRIEDSGCKDAVLHSTRELGMREQVDGTAESEQWIAASADACRLAFVDQCGKATLKRAA